MIFFKVMIALERGYLNLIFHFSSNFHFSSIFHNGIFVLSFNEINCISARNAVKSATVCSLSNVMWSWIVIAFITQWKTMSNDTFT